MCNVCVCLISHSPLLLVRFTQHTNAGCGQAALNPYYRRISGYFLQIPPFQLPPSLPPSLSLLSLRRFQRIAKPSKRKQAAGTTPNIIYTLLPPMDTHGHLGSHLMEG
jgi:hypothetical protein